MDSTVRVIASVAEKVTFASHQNSAPVLLDLELEQTGALTLEDLVIELTSEPAFLSPKTWRLDRLEPGTRSHVLDRKIDLNAGLLFETAESLSGHVIIKVTKDGHTLGEARFPVEVLSRNEWGGAAYMPELLAAFVTPNDPAVDTLLKQAADVLLRAGKPDALNGYESKSSRRVWEMVSALWSAVSSLRLTYALPPASFETNGQKVRTPGVILESRMATCLDTALLFAAGLEQMGLNAILVLTKGHAFVGCWLVPQEFGSLTTDDAVAVRKRIDLGELVVFETTLATNKPAASFSQAVEAAKRQIGPSEEENFVLALDIRRARLQRLRPLALQIKTVEPWAGEDLPPAAESLEEAPPLPDFDIAEAADPAVTPQGRVDQWRRKLLDLTVRNRLLHTKPSSTALKLICPDVARLEDLLADGAKIRIKPVPALEGFGAGGRDADLHQARTGEALLESHARQALDAGEVLSGLDGDALDAQLVELYRKARLDLQEGGANTLFLAMGFLNWKRSEADPRTYRAPLILLPVALERKSARSGVVLTAHEDEPRFNLTLLELLRQDFELMIPELEGDLPIDDKGIDVRAVWTTVRRAVRDVPGFEVVEDLALGVFSFAKYLMWKDLTDRVDQLKSNAVVRHLIDTPREPFVGEDCFPEASRLDVELDASELFAPLPADSSQLAAVVASGRGCDFVLDGPPGTGKSQTIANMIAHNLALGRKVLFVAEKMAALEVVYRRLEVRGLAPFCLELHSNKANKFQVIQQLGRAWDTRDVIAAEEWSQETGKLSALRDELNGLVGLLHAKAENGLSLFEAIGRTVRDADARTPELGWPASARHDKAVLERMRETCRQMDRLFDAVDELDPNAFGPIAADDFTGAWQSEMVAAVTALARAGEAARVRRDELEERLSLPRGPADRARLQALTELSDAIDESHGLDLSFAFVPDTPAVIDALERSLRHLQAYQEAERNLSQTYPAEACRRIPTAALKTRLDKADASLWPLKLFGQAGVNGALKAAAGLATKPNARHDLPLVETLQGELERLDELKAQAGRASAWAGLATDEARLTQTLAVARSLREATVRLTTTPETLGTVRTAVRAAVVDGNELLAEAMPIRQATAQWRTAHAAFEAALERFCTAALCETPLNDPDLFGRVATISAAILADQPKLRDWSLWRKARREALSLELDALVEALEGRRLKAGETLSQFETAYAKWWASVRIDADDRLRFFVPRQEADRVTDFRALDDKVAELTVRYIRAKISGLIPDKNSVSKSSGYGVLRHQLSLQKPRKPIRSLLTEMGSDVTALAPCMLMSPLSVAQYLPADAALFDLVIFDEASQITTWDAVGSLARGRQVVIAGDPRQMPPTNFFQRGAGAPADDEVDDSMEEDLESILDECLSAGLTRHTLEWHYRSRHESLIAFSNHRYYESRLVTFPSAVTRDTTVSLRRVNGAYAKGRSRTNAIEAQAIVEETVKRLRDPTFGGRGRSIAIVTLNSEQQRLVEDLLDKERAKHPALERFFGDHCLEPVVVKNLETVQGDERDLILLGIGYGPETAGAPTMSMNFGPLNRSGGWRRLNVAITRAREEMVIFSSFGPEMVDLNRTSAEAVRDLKHLLEFAERGPRALVEAIQGSVGGFESPFEQAVARGLRDKGWTVVPQIGVSRFRIDLGVVHPDKSGAYLAGVECDGAAYHSAATARDRDKVRAGILTGLGWDLVRVWSTAWWHNRAQALAQLDAELNALLAADREKSVDTPAGPESEHVLEEAPTVLEDLPLGLAEPAPSAAFARAPAQSAEARLDLYRQADLSTETDLNSGAFYEASYTATLQRLVRTVVDAEAPLRLDVLVNRIARAHGFKQSGRLIRERVEQVAKALYLVLPDPDGLLFVWRDWASVETWSRVRLPDGEANVRFIDEVPNAELAALARQLPGLDSAVEIARRLGIRRLSAAARSRLETALASLDHG
ncbi:DUF3320 domain-containing protein [Brevundimonas sp.]|uniref:DUF3320 domain-containing protein n=1 Tax=Brevundimonas sp. TaxID=1871086 RepID=UPI002CA2D2E5|nr:DUF3320 domain-containing protein [Brevundimonas sp.]HWQ86889.1 DUF3320 domain-containing protein [Brevundimonas sp.]